MVTPESWPSSSTGNPSQMISFSVMSSKTIFVAYSCMWDAMTIKRPATAGLAS